MNIISTRQFKNSAFVDYLIDRAEKVKNREISNTSLSGKVLATLFYEASTRTRLSFEASMFKLGGSVISTENAGQFSSAIKGETLEDTIRVVSNYADVIVLRHPENGAAKLAAEHSLVPVINAGDGYGEHPTQALLDVYTVKLERGRINGLHYAMVGDLKYGRTIHSLIYLLGLYEDVRLTLVSPEQLCLPDEVLNFIKERGIEFKQFYGLNLLHEALNGKPDVVYLTRVQTERHKLESWWTDEVVRGYSFGVDELRMLNDDVIIMHPLPRCNELQPDVDRYKTKAAYFRQAGNGLWMRAGLLHHLVS